MAQENQAPTKALSKTERREKLLNRKAGQIKRPHNKHGDKSESAKR